MTIQLARMILINFIARLLLNVKVSIIYSLQFKTRAEALIDIGIVLTSINQTFPLFMKLELLLSQNGIVSLVTFL